MKIYVGMPAYNEEKNIASIIIKIKKLGYPVIVCNDASSDLTADISKELGAEVVNHDRNLGYGGAIQSIFVKARALDADILVTFDADGQHNSNDIPKLIQPILDNDADLVIGSRFLDAKSDMPKYREMGIKVLTKLANISSDQNITDSQSGLRCYNKKCLNSIFPTEDAMGISSEILIKASQEKLKIIELPIIVSYDGDTSTHNPTIHGLSVVATTIKIISIKHPMMFYGIPGFVFLLIGLGLSVLALDSFAQTRTILTNQALLAIGSIIIGLVLLVTGIILFSIISVVREKR
jgi:glycosyltransferase involved in cell wall biosynthesis